MNKVRLIDADELKKCAIPCELHNGSLTELCVPLYQIDSAPTVNIIQYKDWYLVNKAGAKELLDRERSQGEWARHDEWAGGEYIGGFYHVNCPCEDGYYSKWETNFCPNCGLPMKKGGTDMRKPNCVTCDHFGKCEGCEKRDEE